MEEYKMKVKKIIALTCSLLVTMASAMQGSASSSSARAVSSASSYDAHCDARANIKKAQSAVAFILEHIEKLKATHEDLQPIEPDENITRSFEVHYQLIQAQYAPILRAIKELENYFSRNDQGNSYKKNIAQLYANFNDVKNKLEDAFNSLDAFNSNLAASNFIDWVKNLEFVCNQCIKFLQDQALNSAIDLARDEEVQQGVNAAMAELVYRTEKADKAREEKDQEDVNAAMKDLVEKTEYADQLRIERDRQDVNAVMKDLVGRTEKADKARIEKEAQDRQDVNTVMKDLVGKTECADQLRREQEILEQKKSQATLDFDRQLEAIQRERERNDAKMRLQQQKEQEAKKAKDLLAAQQKAAAQAAHEKEQEIAREKKDALAKQGDAPEVLQKFLDDANALAPRQGFKVNDEAIHKRINLAEKAIKNIKFFGPFAQGLNEKWLRPLRNAFAEMEQKIKGAKKLVNLKDQSKYKKNEEEICDIFGRLVQDSWKLLFEMREEVLKTLSSSSSSNSSSVRKHEEKEKEVKVQENTAASSPSSSSSSAPQENKDKFNELSDIVQASSHIVDDMPMPEEIFERLKPLAKRLFPFLDGDQKRELRNIYTLAKAAYATFLSKLENDKSDNKAAVKHMLRLQTGMMQHIPALLHAVENVATRILRIQLLKNYMKALLYKTGITDIQGVKEVVAFVQEHVADHFKDAQQAHAKVQECLQSLNTTIEQNQVEKAISGCKKFITVIASLLGAAIKELEKGGSEDGINAKIDEHIAKSFVTDNAAAAVSSSSSSSSHCAKQQNDKKAYLKHIYEQSNEISKIFGPGNMIPMPMDTFFKMADDICVWAKRLLDLNPKIAEKIQPSLHTFEKEYQDIKALKNKIGKEIEVIKQQIKNAEGAQKKKLEGEYNKKVVFELNKPIHSFANISLRDFNLLVKSCAKIELGALEKHIDQSSSCSASSAQTLLQASASSAASSSKTSEIDNKDDLKNLLAIGQSLQPKIKEHMQNQGQYKERQYVGLVGQLQVFVETAMDMNFANATLDSILDQKCSEVEELQEELKQFCANNAQLLQEESADCEEKINEAFEKQNTLMRSIIDAYIEMFNAIQASIASTSSESSSASSDSSVASSASSSISAASTQKVDSRQELEALLKQGEHLQAEQKIKGQNIELVTEFKDFVEHALRMNFIDVSWKKSLRDQLSKAKEIELELEKCTQKNDSVMKSGDKKEWLKQLNIRIF